MTPVRGIAMALRTRSISCCIATRTICREIVSSAMYRQFCFHAVCRTFPCSADQEDRLLQMSTISVLRQYIGLFANLMFSSLGFSLSIRR